MPQLLLLGFSDGAMRIGSTLSVLKKEGRVAYFVGSDNYFSHAETDAAGRRFALATLVANGHVRASEVEASGLGIAHRTLMHWTRPLAEKGCGSFFAPRPARSRLNWARRPCKTTAQTFKPRPNGCRIFKGWMPTWPTYASSVLRRPRK